jgi:hypothetical protein
MNCRIEISSAKTFSWDSKVLMGIGHISLSRRGGLVDTQFAMLFPKVAVFSHALIYSLAGQE